MPAEASGSIGLSDVFPQVPHLTVHWVDLPGRWWVADPATLTCWVHKGGSAEQRETWQAEAAEAILAAQQSPVPSQVPSRLYSVPRS